MHKLDLVKQKYLNLGVKEDNLDFAIGAVSDGTRREIILETLTADYRGMNQEQSLQLLEDLFEANGGEFRKENRGGYLYGVTLVLIGIIGIGSLIAMLVNGGVKLKFILLAAAVALFGLIQGPILLYKSFRGKYRDEDSPFQDA
ncbi:MAG: hypothetical protein ACTHLE_01775 [Agriterribacter sp.]